MSSSTTLYISHVCLSVLAKKVTIRRVEWNLTNQFALVIKVSRFMMCYDWNVTQTWHYVEAKVSCLFTSRSSQQLSSHVHSSCRVYSLTNFLRHNFQTTFNMSIVFRGKNITTSSRNTSYREHHNWYHSTRYTNNHIPKSPFKGTHTLKSMILLWMVMNLWLWVLFLIWLWLGRW